MTYRNYLQRYFFELYLFPTDGIGYRGLFWYVVVMDGVVEVGDETANSWAFDKTKWLKMIEYELKEVSSRKLTKSQVATTASKCSWIPALSTRGMGRGFFIFCAYCVIDCC